MTVFDDDLENLPNGLYDTLATRELLDAIKDFHLTETPDIDGEEFAQLLADIVSRKLPVALRALKSPDAKVDLANRLIGLISQRHTFDDLRAVKGLIRNSTDDKTSVSSQPEVQLSDFALLTNAHGEPSMLSQLREELLSADAVDILIAFVFQTGLNTFSDLIESLRTRGVRVRLITGVYRGSSEQKAIDYLVNELGVEVKINYETHKNHLHAKAWIIHRNSGFSTAFVGSSNISISAMETGLEWNVRLTRARSPHVMTKLAETFETYWSYPGFESYDPARDQDRLANALSSAKGEGPVGNDFKFFGIDVIPKPHQAQMLMDLVNERSIHNRHKNLVVAATGTGKTVLAALDYRDLISTPGHMPRLLFVAHRKEILFQAQATFQAVLKNPDFGEIWADGMKPTAWTHVFASVQSISSKQALSEFSKVHFEVFIIDEFHHAEASSYRQIIDHFEPNEFLGLTATPERADGIRVQDQFFDGRIASELRLWDALDSGLLAPFHYFGIGEKLDFAKLDWKSGGYDKKALSNLVTGNDVRDRLVLTEIQKKVADPRTMKALFFCVSVQHAEHITKLLRKQGIEARLVTATTDKAERADAISSLRLGGTQAIVTVDVFNEGVDIPEVDTVVMLRPTESPVVFLQQLGRGLRLAKDKSVVTVLDFVGSHRAEYRNDLKLSAMTGVTRGKLDHAVHKGFPYLPSGVVIALDAIAKENVLSNIKRQIRPNKKIIESEIAEYLLNDESDGSIRGYLEAYGRELDEIYRHHSWLEFCSNVTASNSKPISGVEKSLLKSISKLKHVDDPVRLKGYSSILEGKWPHTDDANDYERRLFLMLYRLISPDGKRSDGTPYGSVDAAFQFVRENSRVVREMIEILALVGDRTRAVPKAIEFGRAKVPLFAGATYLRDEILAAIGWANEKGLDLIDSDIPRATQGNPNGVVTHYPMEIDALFVTLNKDEKKFSASTRYKDYALSDRLFHWESPNSANKNTKLGMRLISQPETKSDVLLAIQENKGDGFYLAGLADLESYEGGNPISVFWRLRTSLSPALFKVAATANVA